MQKQSKNWPGVQYPLKAQTAEQTGETKEKMRSDILFGSTLYHLVTLYNA